MGVDMSHEAQHPDDALEAVVQWFRSRPHFEDTVAQALRRALDEVIECQRTGRFSVDQLEKTEKTYIGTKVEIVLRFMLDMERGNNLDNLVCGHEVDTKFSLTGQWMIPREAIGELCLVVSANDALGLFSIGLIRTGIEVLTVGANQDQKRSLSAAGRRQVRWLVREGALPENFLLKLSDEVRRSVLSPRSGKQRILALFENVTNKIIPRYALLQVAQLIKGDPLRRAREAKATLSQRGLKVLCAAYLPQRAEFEAHGFLNPQDDDWLSLRVTEAPSDSVGDST